MSKVDNKPNANIPPVEFQVAAQANVTAASDVSTPVEQNQQPNNDTAHETYCSREGIDRQCRAGNNGNGNGLGRLIKATVGSVIEIVDEDGEEIEGTVIGEDEDSYTVVYDSDGDGKDDKVVKRDKETGHCHGWRKASNEEIAIAAAWAQVRADQEVNSQRIDDTIKANRTQHERILYNRKLEAQREANRDAAEDVTNRLTPDAQRMEHNDSLSIQFQANVPESQFESVSVSEIILNKNLEADLKS